MKRLARVFVVVSAVVSVVSGCPGPASSPAGGGGAKGPAKPVVVRVIEAKAERVDRIVEITGTLAGAEEVLVSSEVEGRVERVAADLGDVVRAGATLVQLARDTSRLLVAQAEADHAAALARVGVDDAGLDAASADQASAVRRAVAERDEARRALARAMELLAKGVAAQADIDAARARADVADAVVAAAHDDALAAIAVAKARRAALGLARKRLADASITSPVDAVVAARLVSLGELVKPGQAIARVVAADTLKLRGDVPERYADVMKRGLPIEVTVDVSGAVGRGVVGRVGPLVDASSRTFPIEAVLDNKDGRLKPGTFARARVVTGADEDVISLPETAISNLAGVTKVFVVDDEQHAVERKVQLLRKRGSDALVAGELKPGERVIITAVARVFPGAVVEVDTRPAPTPSTATPPPTPERPRDGGSAAPPPKATGSTTTESTKEQK